MRSKNKETVSWPEGFRRCVKCKELKQLEEFHKHSRCLFGVNTVCKICRKPLSTNQWQKTTHEYKIWTRAKSRAKIKGLEFSIEIEDIIIPEVCPVFKVPFQINNTDFSASIDRIDPNKGYIKGNIEIISNKANRIKSNATKEEILKVLNYMNSF